MSVGGWQVAKTSELSLQFPVFTTETVSKTPLYKPLSLSFWKDLYKSVISKVSARGNLLVFGNKMLELPFTLIWFQFLHVL